LSKLTFRLAVPTTGRMGTPCAVWLLQISVVKLNICSVCYSLQTKFLVFTHLSKVNME